jgi:hypothetical protein
VHTRLILLIVLGLAAWGIFHAVGAYRFNHDPRRAWVVLVCVSAFVAFWLGLLALRKYSGRGARRPPE